MLKIITLTLLCFIVTGSAYASSGAEHPRQIKWEFDGALGKFDRSSIRRGFQIYQEVCSSCHSLRLVSYRNLEKVGFSKNEVKTLAAEYTVMDGPDSDGELFERPARRADKFVSPFPNENAARASNGGALPPDLSLMVKARPDGANYLYSLLTGFAEAPADVELGDGMSYNPYFPGSQIAMAPPLSEDAVEYHDGTAASVDQMARDVVNFLQWTAEPEMEQRKKMGVKILIFLAFVTLLFIIAKRRVWAKLD